MPADSPDVLLVIPAYREQLRLPPFIDQLVEQLKHSSHSVDILIVDDGSPMLARQKLLQSINPGTYGSCKIMEPLLLEKNQGKGGAILRGWRTGTKARFLAFVDADGAVPAYEVARVLDLAFREEHNEPCFFATRIKMLGRKIDRRLFRHLSGRVFAMMVNLLFKAAAYDTQCGFKIIPSGIFYQIDPLLEETGLCFDIELMLALRHRGACIQEIPIDWEDKAGGKVIVGWHGWGMLWQLIRLRFRGNRWGKREMAGASPSGDAVQSGKGSS